MSDDQFIDESTNDGETAPKPSKASTAEERAQAIESQREARKAKLAEQRAEQYAKDLARLNELEIEHGDGFVAPCEIAPTVYAPGLPTMVILRMPNSAERKRYRDAIRNSKGGDSIAKIYDAQMQLGRACRVYPEAAEFDALIERVDLSSRVAALASKMSDAETTFEGKG